MENMLQTRSSKMDGVNLQVGNIEQNSKHGSNPGFRISHVEGNIPNEEDKKFCSTSNFGQTSIEMQGKHLLTNSVENKQQNQHQSRKINQECCESASNSNRPNNNSSNTSNLDQPLSNLGSRLGYLEGKVPTENHINGVSIPHQYQITGDNYLPKNGQKEKELQAKNYIQSQTIQTNSVMMQGEHSSPVCMHEPKSEREDCQKQYEQQLRNKSVPYTIQQKLDENCCENAANCNKPSSQGNSSNSTTNVSAAQQLEGNNNNNNMNFVAAPQLNRNFGQRSP
ncbi:MAG: hypothetical protein GY820_28185, partial [Gammaproteobacteria bacterium]|nr:hypothetical protein [Gammaproteobacteria bacterium]